VARASDRLWLRRRRSDSAVVAACGGRPVALLVWRGTELEGGISAWLAFLVSVTLAAGIAADVLTRRGLRGREEAQP
jgi:hypothetical protein